MSSLDVPVIKLAQLPQKVKMSSHNVPVHKVSQLDLTKSKVYAGIMCQFIKCHN